MPPNPSGPRLTTTGRPASEARHERHMVRLAREQVRRWPQTAAVVALIAAQGAVEAELDAELAGGA